MIKGDLIIKKLTIIITIVNLRQNFLVTLKLLMILERKIFLQKIIKNLIISKNEFKIIFL
jgi:hypothetical protein